MSEPQGTPTERAILSVVNALAETQREHSLTLHEHSTVLHEHSSMLNDLKHGQDDTNARVRSIEETLAEMKDLIISTRDR